MSLVAKQNDVNMVVAICEIIQMCIVGFSIELSCWLWLDLSLSEANTSMTALHTRVCMFVCLLVWTDHLP